MPYCRQCGAEINEGIKFCPDCGAATAPGYQASPNTGCCQNPQDDIKDNKLISVLCYFGILLLIPLLTKPESSFVKYHSNQGLVLLLLEVALGAVAAIPILGWIVAAVGGIFSMVCFIMGIVNVCNGQMKELPLIGKIQILN